VHKLIVEDGGVFGGGEVAVLDSPAGNGVDNAMHQFADASFALGRAHFAMEIFARDDVSGRLRPVAGNLNIALLENDGTLVVAYGCGAGLPLYIIIRSFARFQTGGKVFGEFHPGVGRFRRVLNGVQLLHFRTCNCG